jgi:hypothetical protein
MPVEILTLWNYVRNPGGQQLEEVEGVTPELAAEIRRIFVVSDVAADSANSSNG